MEFLFDRPPCESIRLGGRIAITRLGRRSLALRGDGGDGSRSSQVDVALDHVRDIRTGAFGPWFQSPAVRTCKVPFGGAVAIAIVDVLVYSGLT